MSLKRVTPHKSSTLRDHSRKLEAKLAAMSRKGARRAKSARLFLSLAFPAELGGAV